MKIALIRVPVSHGELQLLQEVAADLELPLREVLSKGAYAYAGMCGFWTDGPQSEDRLPPIWKSVAREPLVSSVTVPVDSRRFRQVERGWGYVRVPLGFELIRVSLGDFIVLGTLRALLLTQSLRDRLAELDKLNLNLRPSMSRPAGLTGFGSREDSPQ